MLQARRARRTRLKLRNAKVPRLSVFRSNRYVWVQIIDDIKGITLASISSRGMTSMNKIEKAREVGKQIAKVALAKKINSVVFDRGAYNYHGSVKALAEGVREGGLKL